MSRYEMKYLRWQKGLTDKGGKKSFRFAILAPSDRDARKRAQDEWDRLMTFEPHLRPEFIGLFKIMDWKPLND